MPKVKCESIPSKGYYRGNTFTIWYGGTSRAMKKAREMANDMAQRMANGHLPVCKPGDCSHAPKDVGKCACHKGEFFPHERKCGVSCTINAAMITMKTWKTWAGTSAGKYGVGVTGDCSCVCMPPRDIGQPVNILGLINAVAGGAAGGKKQLPKTIADLVKWMKDNL